MQNLEIANGVLDLPSSRTSSTSESKIAQKSFLNCSIFDKVESKSIKITTDKRGCECQLDYVQFHRFVSVDNLKKILSFLFFSSFL